MKKIFTLLTVLMMLLPAAVAEETGVEEVAAPAGPLLEVHQMAIGYADGFLIRVGDIDILIDGGNPTPRWPKDDVLNYLRDAGVETLDACIISHWHLDHCANMNRVLEIFGDENTITYGPSVAPVDEIEYNGLDIEIGPVVKGTYAQIKVDDVIQIGPLTITCVGPGNMKAGGRINGDSLNLVLQYGTRRMLFTGDYTHNSDIVAHEEICSNVDVLKFPHHGSEPFEIKLAAMRITSPTYVLVPSGYNNYAVYKYFVERGIELERDNVLTQRAGHVVIVTDGADFIEARTQQNPADYAPKAP